MNKIYRTFWNPLLQRVVVTHEASKAGAAMRSASAVVGTLLALSAPVALADNVIGTSANQGGFTSTNSFTGDGSNNLNGDDTWISAGSGAAVKLVTTPSSGANAVGANSTEIASFGTDTSTITTGNTSIQIDNATGVTVTSGGFTANNGARISNDLQASGTVDININNTTTGHNDTNINTGTSTGTVSIGNSASTTNILGATNINTGSSTATTTIGNASGGDVTIQSAGTTSVTAGGKGLTINSGTAVTTLSGGTNTSTWTLQDGSAALSVAGGTSGSAKQLISATTNATTTTSAVQIGEAGNSVNTITGSTNNIVGTTNNLGVASGSTNNIGTSGANNNIGSSASTNTIQGATTLTGATTVAGTANINTTGTASTSIGNATGTIAMIGSTVGVGTNNASVVNVGSTSGNSTLNFNNNRLQNVGTAVLGTDAVNLNQLNSTISGIQNQVNSAINGIQNQVNTNKAGIAGVTAATNLPGLSAGQKYNFGVAWGNYQAYNGVAIGGHARVTENVTLKVSGSGTSGVYSGGAGMAIGF